MKALVACLLLLCGAAHAQYKVDCYPLPATKGTMYGWITLDFTANGVIGYYACDLGYKRTRPNWGIEYGALLARVATAGPELARAVSKIDPAERAAALDAFVAKWSGSCKTPAAGNEAICNDLKRALEDNPLPQPVFVVAKNGTSTTRPTRLFTDGALGAPTPLRVLVGAPCNQLDAYTQSGSTVYAGVLGRKDVVAVCVRQ